MIELLGNRCISKAPKLEDENGGKTTEVELSTRCRVVVVSLSCEEAAMAQHVQWRGG
jgi:hypothetical protein